MHYVLERKEIRYPSTPALGRLLVTISIVRPRWSPEVWRDIRKLEKLSGLTFHDYLLTHVSSPMAIPGVCEENPIELDAADVETGQLSTGANSVVAPSSSVACLVSKARSPQQKGKGKQVVGSTSSPVRSGGRPPRGATVFNAPYIGRAGDGSAAAEVGGGSPIVVALSADRAEDCVGPIDPGPLVPYSDSSDSDATINFLSVRRGQLHCNSAPPVGDGSAKRF